MNMYMRQLANVTIGIKGCVIAISWHLVCYVRTISCRDMSNFVGILVEEPGFKNVKNKHLGMPPF